MPRILLASLAGVDQILAVTLDWLDVLGLLVIPDAILQEQLCGKQFHQAFTLERAGVLLGSARWAISVHRDEKRCRSASGKNLGHAERNY
jgi:hypothetical protein